MKVREKGGGGEEPPKRARSTGTYEVENGTMTTDVKDPQELLLPNLRQFQSLLDLPLALGIVQEL